MKIKYLDAILLINNYDKFKQIDFPALVALKLARIVRKCSELSDDFNKVREETLLKHGYQQITDSITEEEQEKIINANKDVIPIINEELTTLMQSEVEINVEKIKVTDLEKWNSTISLDDIQFLLPFMED